MSIDKLTLLHAPYVAPEVVIGAKLFCLYRGREVPVTGFSSAPIPWPVGGVKKGYAAIIVCDDLERAIRHEAGITVAHHFGVHQVTVSQWRKSLGIGRTIEGTHRLRGEIMRAVVASPAHAAHYENMRDPVIDAERRRKISEANRRPPKPPKPKPPKPFPKLRKWTAEEDAILLTLPEEPSPEWKALERSESSIIAKRKRLRGEAHPRLHSDSNSSQ